MDRIVYSLKHIYTKQIKWTTNVCDNVMNGFEEEKSTSLYFVFKACKPHFNLFLKASNLSTEEFLYLAMRECYRVYGGQVGLKNKRK